MLTILLIIVVIIIAAAASGWPKDKGTDFPQTSEIIGIGSQFFF